MHGFIAQLVDVESNSIQLLQETLSEAGCLDIDPAAQVGDIVLREGELQRPLVIVAVHRGNIANLQRLVASHRPLAILAVCDESDMDLVFATGVPHVVSRPLRRREVLGRIREAMRRRTPAEHREGRERTMSNAIQALQREKQVLERLVCVDALTGIANRRHLTDLLASEWKRAARDQSPFALIMIDLDCFHAFNERYGHLGGDGCLQRVADAMVRSLRRPSDFLGRYGGEEFMAVLPNTDAVGAKIVAERLRAAVEDLGIPHEASSCSSVVTITVGFASIHVLPEDSIESLVGAADGALLQAKTYGRNRVGGIAPLVRPSRVSSQAWKRYAPVCVDPWFASRVPAFLNTVKEQLWELTSSLRSGERRTGLAMRRLRNVARELGLVGVEILIRDVEEALREGELAALRPVLDELLDYVTHVQVIYRRTEDAAPATVVA